MADLQKIVTDLSSLTVLEAAELAKMLEEKWGVSAAAAVAVAAAPGAAAAPVEEKTEFTVMLAAIGDKQQHTVATPAAASAQPCSNRSAGHLCRATARRYDLEGVIDKECNEPAVWRPERKRCAVGAGKGTGVGRVDRPDPELDAV